MSRKRIIIGIVVVLLVSLGIAARRPSNNAGPEDSYPGGEDSFVMVDASNAAATQLGPLEVSVVRTHSQGEPEILVAGQGALEWRVDAPDGQTYSQLSMPGCGATADDIGYPLMPFKGFFLEIPYGVEVSVKLSGRSARSVGKGFLIYPKQRPLPDSGEESESVFEIDKEAYATDGFFPPAPVAVGEPGFIRGRRVVFVQVFPLQYNPVSTELRAFSSLRFRLMFKGKPDKKGEMRKKRLATRQSEALGKQLIMNYKKIGPKKPKETEVGIMSLSTSDAADYLIIVVDDLYEEILPLAEWKHKKGLITRVTKTTDIDNDPNKYDIESYIQDAYDEWDPAPSYVLLVGDSEDVPPHEYSGGYPCDTDQLYACVDGNDYYPDLTIARLPVHTESECNDVVDKILTYDRDPNTGDWYDDFLSAGYFQDSGTCFLGLCWGDNDGIADRWFMETSMTIRKFLLEETDYQVDTAWCTTYWPLEYETYHFRDEGYPHRSELNQIRWGVSPYRDPVPSSLVALWTDNDDATDDVTLAINSGVGIVQHRDHGNVTLWGDPPYDTDDIDDLSNGEKTPVVFSINCLTGDFTASGGDCFCEAFLKKSPGGCVGTVGATRTSFSGYNDLMVHGIYTCFWPGYDPSYVNITYQGSWRPAEALTYGKYYMYIYEGDDDGTEAQFYMFHWFGDPEMMMRTKTPEALSVSYVDAVVSDTTTAVDLTVTVTKDGAPLQGALVAITHPDTNEDHWTGLTSTNGAVTFSNIVLSDANDDYDIVVTAHDCIPHEGQIAVYSSIQDAIDDADDGDEIIVCATTFYETIDFDGKAITLRSSNPDDPCVVAATIIDANGSATAVTFDSSEDANAVLTGFTITGGGRGIYCEGTSPTVRHCVVTGNGIESVLAHWKLDDDADSNTVVDSSGNGNDGTSSKNTSLLHTDSCKVGSGAFVLDGSADYVNIGNNVKPSLPISVSMWIEPNSLGTNQYLLANDKCTGSNYYGIWGYIKDTNAISISYGDGGSPAPSNRRSKVSASTVSSDEWQHIAFVIRGPQDMDICINGTDAGGTYSGTGGALAYSSADGSIGSHAGSSYFFDGTIDEVTVFDRALSEGEVDSLYDIDRVGMGRGLAHWKMDDDADNTTVVDSTGNGHTATASKNTSLFHTDSTKVGSGGFVFDGQQDYINIGNTVKPSLPISVSMWIEPNSLGTNQWLLENNERTGGNYYGISSYVKTDNKIAISYGDGGYPGPGSRRSKSSSSMVSSGQWQHIAFVIRGPQDMDIYINATDAGGTYSGTGGALAYSSGNGSIGARAGTAYFFDGTIDDVMVFDRALSEDEVGTLYGIGGGGMCCIDSASPTITDCAFNSNSAIYGAGLSSINSSPTATNCVFSKNVASVDGGGIYDQNSSANLTGCVLSGNWAFSGGGGIASYSSAPNPTNCIFTSNWANYGGGMANYATDSTLNNGTFSDNSGNFGGGMYNWNSDPTVTDCIFWGDDATDTGDEIYNYNSDPNFRYCDIEGCGGSSGWDPNFGTDGGENIDDDPLFVNPNDHDYHLGQYSPCINAGDPNGDYEGQADMDGDPRVVRTRVDIGADEVRLVWYVDGTDGDDDNDGKSWDEAFETIGKGITTAVDWEIVEVNEGTYYEDLDFDGKAITLRSTDPQDWEVVDSTIIDADGEEITVEFSTSEDGNSVLTGFRITGADYQGIKCSGASPAIANCIIKDNGANEDGGGMCNRYGSSPTVTNCIFKNNDAEYGGGIYNNESSSPTVTNCAFVGNEADEEGGGIYNEDGSSPTVTNCIFKYNQTMYDDGAGMANDESSPTIINCTFTGNDAEGGRGGGIYNNHDSSPTLINCIFWDNSAHGSGDEIYNGDRGPTFSYCCIRDGLNGDRCGGDGSNDGGGNIDDDPCFYNSSDGNGPDNQWLTFDDGFRLDSDSPCIDAGDNGAISEATDAAGTTRKIDDPSTADTGNATAPIVDMGAYEYNPGS